MHPLLPDTSYHIFNHANGFENIFRHEANYWFFMEKYRKYIGPVAETYAWCLMPNHFHLVLRIRKRQVLEDIIFSNSIRFSKVIGADQRTYKISKNFLRPDSKNFGKSISGNENFGKIIGDNFLRPDNKNFGKSISGNENFRKVISDHDIEKYLSKQFANLFSCYTQSFNKVYGRMGSLFIKNFKREPVLSKTQFLNTIIYTHRNPIHHGFCNQYDEWPFSSYLDVINGNNDGLETGKLLKMAGGLDALVDLHRHSLEKIDTSNYPDIPLIP